MQFAHYPPPTITVTHLWDKHARPDWREIARRNEAEGGEPRHEAQDRDTVAELTSQLDAAEPLVGHEARLSSDAADYLLIRRQVPVTRGKWRMASKEVENATPRSGGRP